MDSPGYETFIKTESLVHKTVWFFFFFFDRNVNTDQHDLTNGGGLRVMDFTILVHVFIKNKTLTFFSVTFNDIQCA